MNRPPPSKADIDRAHALYGPVLDRLERGEITQAQADAQLEEIMHRGAVAYVEAQVKAAGQRGTWIPFVVLMIVVFATCGWVIVKHL